MGRYSKHISRARLQPLPESLWEKVSTGEPINSDEFCRLNCRDFEKLSNGNGQNRYSFNVGKCKYFKNELVCADSSICFKTKESK